MNFKRMIVILLSFIISQFCMAEPLEHILNEANRALPYRLEFLKNCPEMIPTLAQWLYDEWLPYDASLTMEKLIRSFEGRLNDDRIPFTLVAVKENKPIGVISLKWESAHEFSDFPQGLLWMGSLQVAPEERRAGLGQRLLECAEALAKTLGYKEIYFYTSNSKNVPWYVKRGAEVLEERSFRGHTISIMRIDFERELLH